MATLQQDDLFSTPAVVARNVPRETSTTRMRRKPLAETSHEAGRARPASKRSQDRARCLAEIARAQRTGCTRQELADRLEMPIQTVCWTVDALLTDGSVFEPVIGVSDQGSAIHLKRDKKKVIVDAEHRAHYLPSPSYAADQVARIAS